MTAAYFEDHPTDPEKVILRKPRLDQGPDYERGFIDGMQHQMQSSVDKAVNRMATPKQKAVAWKLVPVEPTEEMLKAMDECSKDGYDERLYAGHAASVYMAAVDVAPTPPQPEQCRKEKHENGEYVCNCKAGECPQFAQPEQEPVAWGVDWGRAGQTPCVSIIKRLNDGRIEVVAVEYGPQRTWVGLTPEEILRELERVDPHAKRLPTGLKIFAHYLEAKLKEKNT